MSSAYSLLTFVYLLTSGREKPEPEMSEKLHTNFNRLYGLGRSGKTSILKLDHMFGLEFGNMNGYFV